jgi:molecular chaperone DnaK
MAVVGIDLGTTNSVVATLRGEQVLVIPDAEGRRLHPSVVSFLPEGGRLYSFDAVARRIIDPRHTVYSAKRLIGLPFRSDEVRLAASRLPYEVREGANEQAVFLGPGDSTFTIPEVSGALLSYLKKISEAHLDEPVTGAVITVPANFNDAQRRATMDAGRIAGLEVLRVLNEPTAAALAYGAGQNISQRIAVYDFGGGTFDVTILQVEGYVFEVLATGGDTFLGGDDADSMLMGTLAETFSQQYGVDPLQDPGTKARLLLAAEQIKRHLSDNLEARGELKNLGVDSTGQPISVRFHVTRTMFENSVGSLVSRTFQTCQEVLTAAQLTPSQIDEVILVGGSTRMPLVREEANRYFGRPPRTDINPDEVVAWGAAIQAEILANAGSNAAPQAVLLDVTPRALGIAVSGGYAEKIVDKNIPVPVEKTRLFATSADNQTVVRIQVCQGESRRFEENIALGELELAGIPAARRGEVKIEVTFRVDTNGILRVRAQDPATGMAREAAVSVRGTMTEEEVGAAADRQELAGAASTEYSEMNLPEGPV